MNGLQLLGKIGRSIPEKGMILDAGCGNGQNAHIFQTAKRTIICLDIYKPKPSTVFSLPFVQGSVECLPFKDCTFDCIYCLSVLELIRKEEGVIEEFHRVLKPGGGLIFTVPTRYSIFRAIREMEKRFGVYRYPAYDVPYYHYYSRKDLFSLLNDLFRIECILAYNYNFLPRLISFFFAVFKMRISASNQHDLKIEESKDLPQERGIDCTQEKFRFVKEFAYHWIVLAKKKEPE